MSEKLVVSSDLTPDWFAKYNGIIGEINKQLIRGLKEPGKGLALDHLQAVVEHRNPFEVAVASFAEALVSRTAKLLSKKFGKQVAVDPLPAEFTEENLSRWAGFNLKPVFLPDEEIDESQELKKWIKPDSWFYDQISNGKIKPGSATLYRGWYLADFTVGADYANGTQVFFNDPLAPTVTRLREQGKVGKYDDTPIGSRFAITNDEWRNTLCPAIAQELGFNPDQVRLERAIEFNAIGNLYDSNRGKFNIWEWFADTFGGDPGRLFGGHRGVGSLAHISFRWSDSRRVDFAGRPLVSFV